MTKAQLVGLVMVLEQNVENLHDTLEIQYQNAMKMVNDITSFREYNDKRKKEKLAL